MICGRMSAEMSSSNSVYMASCSSDECGVSAHGYLGMDTVDDINPALPIKRLYHDSHSLGPLR